MSVAELRSKIATVNATVARLNEQRVRNMGMRETLEKQKASSIAMYLEKYGVDLSTVDINAEYERVMGIKEAEVNLMPEVIGCIESGDYARANQLMQVSVEGAKIMEVQNNNSVVDTVAPEIAPVVNTPAVSVPTPQAPVSAPVVSAPQVDIPMSGIESLASPVVSAPASPLPRGVTPPPTPAVAPPLGGVSAPSVAPPVSAPPISAPTPHVGSGLDLSGLQLNVEAVNRATDFSGILGGQQFVPQ